MMNRDHIAQALNTSVERHDFSGVIRVRHQGAVLYERAAGYADRSNRVANTLATRFGIASGTKFFTALAIGKLIAAQQLSLDTRLRDCIALNVAHYSPEITIRHLLTHTSGIPDYYDEEQIADFDSFAVSVPWYALKGPRDYLAVLPDAPMKFAPGARFAYSNSGYILLGVIIEELTGQRYQDFVAQALFKAIGMDRSGYFALNRLPEQTALGYIEDAQGWRTNIYNLPIVGASDGGAFTTLDDIETLWRAFWGGAILPQTLVELYARPYVQANTRRGNTFYGHGLWIYDDGGPGREEFITGSDAGVSFKSIVQRAHDLQITVIANTSHGAWPVLADIDAALQGGEAT